MVAVSRLILTALVFALIPQAWADPRSESLTQALARDRAGA